MRVKDFLAVVAEDEWTARARRRARSRRSGASGPACRRRPSSPQSLRAGPFIGDETLVNKGDAARALPDGAKALTATYYWPMQSHASIGPSCAVADVRADAARRCGPPRRERTAIQTTFARFLGLPQDKVRLIYLEGSGCYGMNGHEDAAADAAILSRAVGRPVRVQWSREDEHGWDPKGPPQLLDISGAVGATAASSTGAPRCGFRRRRAACRIFRCWRPRRPASTTCRGLNTGLISQNGDPPYAAEQHPGRRALAQGHAVAPGADPFARQAGQLLRGRKLHRRACGGGRRRSGRVPPARA